jgi:CDP-diglyceride synthetase
MALVRRIREILDNPLITYHLLFVLGLFFLYVVSDNSFFAQGRHFYPVLLSGFYLAFIYIPDTFKRGRFLFWVLFALTVAYDVVGQYYAYRDMAGRFYGEGRLY